MAAENQDLSVYNAKSNKNNTKTVCIFKNSKLHS